ncbi:BREX-2 system phosphatase PglZ [Amycolatopsis plumensis]|uniref:BREX-2 system phosphatase PglZ n=1 Tax=Amycolatopsis plumensis TaxID=236508 RepID=A0ABV5U6U8_9PSEU
MVALPLVTQSGIESLLDQHKAALAKRTGQCLVLVRGHYEPGERTEFRIKPDGDKRPERVVRVTDQPSVLGIAAEWLDHQDTGTDSGVLVVTTAVTPDELDWDLRGHALKTGLLSVDPVDILKFRFGVNRLDPRVWQSGWLVQALLEAEPTSGWPRRGGVLTYDDALAALITQRLGVDATTIDMDRLLEWSQTTGPTRWTELADAEQDGIRRWLVERVGPAIEPLLTLVATGRGRDALALGVVGTALEDPSLSRDALISVGGLFPGMRSDAVQAFSSAVDGTLSRWIAAVGHEGSQTRHEALVVLEHADELANRAGLGPALTGNALLPSAWYARLRALGKALPDPVSASRRLSDLRNHRLAELFTAQLRTAAMAVRLARWLATPESGAQSVAAGAHRQITEGAWVDYAIAALWAGDGATEPVCAMAYRNLCELAVARRTTMDELFAQQLVTWVPHARSQFSESVLLVEDVLATAAVPLTTNAPPVVILLDGMSSSVAVQLGAELGSRPNWLEAAPIAGQRLAAVSTIPSITTVSRPSLLTGQPTSGGQAVEKDGFAAFWKRHHRQARLFHENEVAGGAGQTLNPELVTALAGDDVVGVVLNTIDDTLGPGREGDGTLWRLEDVRFLTSILTQARSYGRPVILTADHGHVLERGLATGPAPASGDYGARWRTGTPGAGEVELHGPRVLEGNGKVVVPWREDIRYTNKRAGYHGGASLAEVVVPVIVLLPSVDALPRGWHGLAAEQTTPAWWEATSEPVVADKAVPKPNKAKAKPKAEIAPDAPGLFDHVLQEPEPSLQTKQSLGWQVTHSDIFRAQKAFVRKAPESALSTVIDALVEAGGKLSLAAISATAGKAARNIDGFLATAQRLLNIEGYPVLEIVDNNRTVELNVELLCVQFQLGKP